MITLMFFPFALSGLFILGNIDPLLMFNLMLFLV